MAARAAVPLGPVCSHTRTIRGTRAETNLGPSSVPRGPAKKKWNKQEIAVCAWEAQLPRGNREDGGGGRRGDDRCALSHGVTGEQGLFHRLRRLGSSIQNRSLLRRGMLTPPSLLDRVGGEGTVCLTCCCRFQSSSRSRTGQVSPRVSRPALPRVLGSRVPRLSTEIWTEAGTIDKRFAQVIGSHDPVVRRAGRGSDLVRGTDRRHYGGKNGGGCSWAESGGRVKSLDSVIKGSISTWGTSEMANKRCGGGVSVIRRGAVNDQVNDNLDAMEQVATCVESERTQGDVAVYGDQDDKGMVIPEQLGIGGVGSGGGEGGGGGGGGVLLPERQLTVAEGDSFDRPTGVGGEELVAQNGDGGRGVVAEVSADLLSMLSSSDPDSVSIVQNKLNVGDGSHLESTAGESLIERNRRKRRERELKLQQQGEEMEEEKGRADPALSSSSSSSSSSSLSTVGMALEEQGSSMSSGKSLGSSASAIWPLSHLADCGDCGNDGTVAEDPVSGDWYTMPDDERWLVRLDQSVKDWEILGRLVNDLGDQGGDGERGSQSETSSDSSSEPTRVALEDRRVLWALVSYMLKREEESLSRLEAALSSGASDDALEEQMSLLSPFPPTKRGAAAGSSLGEQLAAFLDADEEDDVAVRFLTLALRRQGIPLSDFIYDLEGACISNQTKKISIGFEIELIRRLFLSRGRYPHLTRLAKVKNEIVRRVIKPAGFQVESVENLPFGLAVFGKFEDVSEQLVVDENGRVESANFKSLLSSSIVEGRRSGGGDRQKQEEKEEKEKEKEKEREILGYWEEDGFVIWEEEEEEVVDLEPFRKQVQKQLDAQFPGLVVAIRPSPVDDEEEPMLVVGPANEYFTLSFPLWLKLMGSMALSAAATWLFVNLSGIQMLASDDVAPWLLAMAPAVLLSVIGGGWLARKGAAFAHGLPHVPDPVFPLPSPLVGSLGSVTTYKGVLNNRACEMDLSLAATLAMVGISAASIFLGSGSSWDSLSLALWGQTGQALLVPEAVVHHSATLTKLSELASFGVLVGEHDESLLMMSPLAVGGVLGLNSAAFGMIPTRRLDGARVLEAAVGGQLGLLASDLVAVTVAVGLLLKGSVWLAATWTVWMLTWRSYNERMTHRDELSDPGLLRIGCGVLLMLGAGLVIIP